MVWSPEFEVVSTKVAMMLRCMAVMAAVAMLAGSVVAAAEAAPGEADQLKASQAKWQKARDAAGGEYSYIVRRVFFVGAQTTTVKVKDGKVVERTYLEQGPPQPVPPGAQPPVPQPKWVETGKEVGTHKEGAPARTVDELYAEALKVAAQPLAEHEKRYVGFDEQGLLTHCFVMDTRIADDAPQTGVTGLRIALPKR
jgi:hypothetical protein